MKSTKARFFEKVAFADGDDCLLWTASKNKFGYGQFFFNGKPVRAHRFSYQLLVGMIPENLQLDHLCRVRHCVNPDHLEPVTGQVNVLRGETVAARNAARTTCPQGHPYDQFNTLVDSAGKRKCRECKRVRSRAYYRAARAKRAVQTTNPQ